MRRAVQVVCGLLAVGLGGCAGPQFQFAEIDPGVAQAEAERQRESFVADLLYDTGRVGAVWSRIQVANAELCERHAPVVLGMGLYSVQAFSRELRPAAARVLGGADGVRVAGILPGRPTDRAGLRQGDRILEVGSTAVGTAGGAVSRAKQAVRDELREDGSVRIVVQRGAERNVLSLRPEVGCDYGVGVELSPELNAFADGERVLITRGMVDFLDQDDDLALVLGHELAHNTYGHIEKKMAMPWWGRSSAASWAPSQAPTPSSTRWNSEGSSGPWRSVRSLRRRPTTRAHTSLERTAEEIALKKSRRQPLTPGGTPPIHVE